MAIANALLTQHPLVGKRTIRGSLYNAQCRKSAPVSFIINTLYRGSSFSVNSQQPFPLFLALKEVSSSGSGEAYCSKKIYTQNIYYIYAQTKKNFPSGWLASLWVSRISFFFFFTLHFTFLFYVLQNTHHKKKDGTIFVDPSPYTINLLIAYDENTFFYFFFFILHFQLPFPYCKCTFGGVSSVSKKISFPLRNLLPNFLSSKPM